METQKNLRSLEAKRLTTRLAAWTGAWMLSFALVNFGSRFLWDYNETISIIAVLVNLVLGAGMVISNIRHLRNLDELQRKISLEAMGITLGVTLVVGLAYSNLDIANVIPFDAEISHVVILMGLCYLFSILILNSRYK
ncbi:hypothetical protein [Zunongwangia sp. H14]|uniref:hypothetical protein n=1 Tax=Zunongwangia sp. H14 TaxID=3240792 RepID=UPI0035668992